MGVGSAATGRASKNRTRACTHGRVSRAGRTVMERNLYALLARAAPEFAERTRGRVWVERMTEEPFTT